MSYYTLRLGDKLRSYTTGARKKLSDSVIFAKIIVFSLKTLLSKLIAHQAKSGCLNIGIILSGGIGDQMISAQWSRAFLERLHQDKCNCHVVFLVHNLKHGAMLTDGMAGDYQVLSYKKLAVLKFDLLLDADYFVKVLHVNHGAVRQHDPNLAKDILKAEEFTRTMWLLAPASSHFQLMNYALYKGWSRYDLMGACGLCDFGRDSKTYFKLDDVAVKDTLAKYGIDRPFITIHTGVGDIPNNANNEEERLYLRRNATRCIPKSLGESIVSKLHELSSDYMIVQVGDNSSHVLEDTDLNLCNKISFDESLNLIYAAAAHIDNDAGLIHLRHAMNKRSVVLYGPTDGRFVGYHQDINLQGNCQPCMWLTQDWNTKCPAGHDGAKCMHSISATEVAQGALQIASQS